MEKTAAAPTAAEPTGNILIGILCVIGAGVAFSLNDVGVKWLSGDYPLHQLTFLRSIVALLITFFILVPLESSFRNLLTDRLGLHILRGFIVVIANMSFFTGLATMSLGEATAIYFVAPLFITALSVVLLNETVGRRRWLAVIVGLIGVVVVIQPGSSTFQYAAMLPLLAAGAYALLQITTRKLGLREKASTMAFYIQATFLIFSGGVGLIFSDGSFSGTGNENLEFLFRAWTMPDRMDGLIILMIGIITSAGGYLISQGYRLCNAGIAAPFEYIALPLSIIWSIALWGHWPNMLSWIGIVLITGAGLYVFFRESALGRPIAWKLPTRRGR